MNTIFTYPMSMVRGRTKTLLFTATYPFGDLLGRGGQPIDLTGATFVSTIRPDEKAAAIIAIGTGITVALELQNDGGSPPQPVATTGQFLWQLAASATAALVAGRYVWQLTVTLVTGEIYEAVWSSDLNLN